jgi:hypothetical protein
MLKGTGFNPYIKQTTTVGALGPEGSSICNMLKSIPQGLKPR